MKPGTAVEDPDTEKRARLFVSVPLTPPLVKVIRELQPRLDAAAGNGTVRWTPPEQLHLTLRFLGDVPLEQIEESIARLRDVCVALPPFQLRLGKPGCFPTPRNPRILWVGLEGQIEDLDRLHGKLAPAFDGIGDHLEKKPFHPHLTIGRIKHGTHPGELGRVLAEIEPPPPLPWPVASVHLMQSHLSPQGARHVSLADVPLAGGE